MYSVFLDEFGHIGPYVARTDERFKTSPVFGLAGFFVHHSKVRELSHWFYKLKCETFEAEIAASGRHPAEWEKKGNSIFTHRRVYQTKRRAFSLLNQISHSGGKVFYSGIEKYQSPEDASASGLYQAALTGALHRLERCFRAKGSPYQIIMDQHNDRSKLMLAAAKTMYSPTGAHSLVELPYQVESHLYSTVQMADWIASIVGSLWNYRTSQNEFPDEAWAEKYFASRLDKVVTHSNLKRAVRDQKLNLG